MASSWYNHGGELIANGTINLNSATLKCMLVRDTYTFNTDHEHVSDINTYELSVTGYTGGYGGAGRKTLGSRTFGHDDTNDYATMDASDLAAWTSLGTGQTIAAAVIIVEGTSDSDSHPLFYVDFTDVAAGGDFTLQWNASGIVRWKHV